MNQHEEHLRMLSMFHYVLGGIMALFSLFPLIHLGIGLFLVFAPEQMSNHGEQPPAVIGWMFVIIAASIIILGLTTAILIVISGRCIARRRRLIFSTVMAGIMCVFMPLGTILGVFSLITLTKPQVKELYRVG